MQVNLEFSEKLVLNENPQSDSPPASVDPGR